MYYSKIIYIIYIYVFIYVFDNQCEWDILHIKSSLKKGAPIEVPLPESSVFVAVVSYSC